MRDIALAFDTSNEVIAIGVGRVDVSSKRVSLLSQIEVASKRASNTKLLGCVSEAMRSAGVERESLACIAVGRGPGSFTGVRIAMATAKGIASALGLPLVGLSTQEAVAWGAWRDGIRGKLLVASDAMRKEIYPSYFMLDDHGVMRLTADRVVKAKDFSEEPGSADAVTGDALEKYEALLQSFGGMLEHELWTPSGSGLLLALQSKWQHEVDILDEKENDPALLLPIYTRLSDAEENERAALSDESKRDLSSGVQHKPSSMTRGDVAIMPLDVSHVHDVFMLESRCMGSEAWSEQSMESDLKSASRTWWMALQGERLVGYAGVMIAQDEAELLKIAVDEDCRSRGIAKALLSFALRDAASLAAEECFLEVRASNEAAIAFYERIGFHLEGRRRGYYSDGEDAMIMKAPIEGILSTIAKASDRVAGMSVSHTLERAAEKLDHPYILAIESSCDETAASVIDGQGRILSNAVASQIDFHARFGGVVPEIASRKHVEAICGVCDVALASARAADASLDWGDIDAVAATYAPGLVGALVVGVAFAKGASWALDVPFIGVNHLEGHLYANKLACEDSAPFAPPAVVSLVSGGNTMLVYMRDWQDYEVIGQTIDDAVGEAFDKVAKALGLPYPGGPEISRFAKDGNPSAIDFPRALMHSGDLRFSLSGLKTAVITYINQQRDSRVDLDLPDICASFQQAVIDVQVFKAKKALERTEAKTFCLGGGVAANPELRHAYEELCSDMDVRLVMPPIEVCGDNAAMIALVALDRFHQGKFFDLDADAYASADLSKPY